MQPVVRPLVQALTVATLLFLPAGGTAAPPAQGQETQEQEQEQEQQAPQQLQAPSRTQRTEAAPSVNVRVEVTLTDQTGAGQPFTKNVGLVIAGTNVPTGATGMSRSSIQVPVRTTTVVGENAGAASPVVSYNYRNMSLNLDVRDVTVEANRVRLRLSVEYSPVDEKTADARDIESLASFASFQQTVTLMLDNGKPLLVAESSDPVPTRNRKVRLEAKATILQ